MEAAQERRRCGSEARVTTRRQSANGMQRRHPNTFGVAIALVALGLQLAAAALHLPLAIAASAGSDAQLAGLFDEHALCLAADANRPASGAPAGDRPTPATHHLGLCCP